MFVEYAILLISLYFIWAIAENYFPSRKLPPGPFRFPLIGNLHQITLHRSKPPFIMFRDFNKKYGPVSFLQMGVFPTVLIDDFNTAKQLLNSEVWIDRPLNEIIMERSYMKPLGIIFVSGEGWREMRRFSMRSLRDLGYGKQTSMQESIDEEVKLLLETVDRIARSGSSNGVNLDMKHLFTMPVLNILWSMVSVVRMPGDEEKMKKLAMLVDNLARATPMGGSIVDLFPVFAHIAPGLTGMTFVRQCIKELQEYFAEVLDTRRKEGYTADGRDFIDMFIKEIERHKKLGTNPNHYTDEQFITTITDLFEAGSETSSNTLEFAMYYTIKNPRVHKKIQEEIDRVVGRSRLPSMADRANMPYTEATLTEVQRMANVLPVTIRSPTENTTLDNYFIPKGSIGIVNIFSIHMNKEFWGDPFNFRPERFLDENNKIITSKTQRVIPFGAGKRVCLGEQMARATIFSYYTALMQSYNFEDNQKEGSSNPDPEAMLTQKLVNVGFTLSPNSFYAKLTKRA